MQTLILLIAGSVMAGCAAQAVPPPGNLSAEPIEWYYQPDASRVNATHPVIDRNDNSGLIAHPLEMR